MKDILFTGGNATEKYPWGLPGIGYVARTKAQAKNTAIYVGSKWLLKLTTKQINEGAYFYTSIEHYTRRYGRETVGHIRGYVNIVKGKKYIEFSPNALIDKPVAMSVEEAKRFIERMSKVIPKSR